MVDKFLHAFEIAKDIDEMLPDGEELDEYAAQLREQREGEGGAPAMPDLPVDEETSISSSSVAHEEMP
jgi:hypothetical protein